jgi:hypothetical protein
MILKRCLNRLNKNRLFRLACCVAIFALSSCSNPLDEVEFRYDVISENCVAVNGFSFKIKTMSNFKGHVIENLEIPSKVKIEGEKYKVEKIKWIGSGQVRRITIPNTVTSIEDGAFAGCGSLICIELPNSVTNIGKEVFRGCLFLTKVTMPNSIESIGDRAFWGCYALNNVTIPNSVTSIGDYAFSDCDALNNVMIPNSVTSVGDSAFWGCNALKTITIEAETPPIGTCIFAYTPIETIYVPAASVEKYKAAEGWSEYADKIKAIPIN